MTYLQNEFHALGQVQSLSLSTYNDTRGRFSHVDMALFGATKSVKITTYIDHMTHNLPILDSIENIPIEPLSFIALSSECDPPFVELSCFSQSPIPSSSQQYHRTFPSRSIFSGLPAIPGEQNPHH
jgi:hypothetical protein